jgi:hypothetical protein
MRATSVVGAFVRGFQAEGYDVPWDAAAGGRLSAGIDKPGPTRCTIVLWTSEAPTSRWVPRYAEDALRRGALVEVLLEKVASPFDNDEPPLDFSDPAVRDNPTAHKALWRELIRRVEAKGGQPTGKLPFRKQIEPLIPIFGLAPAIVLGLSYIPQGAQPNSMVVIESAQPIYADAIQASAPVAMGGPVVAPSNLVTARLEEEVLKPLHARIMRFEVIQPPARVRIAEAGEAADDAGEVIRPARLKD